VTGAWCISSTTMRKLWLSRGSRIVATFTSNPGDARQWRWFVVPLA
jgi:hypothetical protein